MDIDETHETSTIADRYEATEGAGAVAMFVISFALFLVSLGMLGHAASLHDLSGAPWLAGALIGFSVAFALPMANRDR